MRYYAVQWVVTGAGERRLPDPACSWDGDRADRYGTDIIYAKNGKVAADLVKQARPLATKLHARLLVEQ